MDAKQVVLNKFTNMLSSVAAIPQSGISPERAEEILDELMPLLLKTVDIYTDTRKPNPQDVQAHKTLYAEVAQKYEGSVFESLVFTAKWMVSFAEVINKEDFEPNTTVWVFFQNNEVVNKTLQDTQEVLLMSCREIMVQSAGIRRSVQVFKEAAESDCPEEIFELLRAGIEGSRKKLILSIETKVDGIGDRLKHLSCQIIDHYPADMAIASMRLEQLLRGVFEYLEEYVRESGRLINS